MILQVIINTSLMNKIVSFDKVEASLLCIFFWEIVFFSPRQYFSLDFGCDFYS